VSLSPARTFRDGKSLCAPEVVCVATNTFVFGKLRLASPTCVEKNEEKMLWNESRHCKKVSGVKVCGKSVKCDRFRERTGGASQIKVCRSPGGLRFVLRRWVYVARRTNCASTIRVRLYSVPPRKCVASSRTWFAGCGLLVPCKPG